MCVRERERESEWTLKCSLLNNTCSPPVSFLSMGERNDKTPLLIPISFCLSRFPSSCISVSLLPSLLTFPIVTFLSRAANTKAKWLYMLYSSCISECVTDVLLAVHEGFIGISIITRVCCNFSHLWDLFYHFVTVYTCMNVVSNIHDIQYLQWVYCICKIKQQSEYCE